MKDNTDEQIKNIVRELKNTYGTFTWWIDNDHSIEVEIPPELFEVLTQSLQKYGERVRKETLKEVFDLIEQERIDGHFPLYSDDIDRLTSLTKGEKTK